MRGSQLPGARDTLNCVGVTPRAGGTVNSQWGPQTEPKLEEILNVLTI